MRRKRLLCICIALALLLVAPARAAEGTTEGTTVTETAPVNPAPEPTEEVPEIPGDLPAETPDLPEETPEVPEVPAEGPELPGNDGSEDPAPAESGEPAAGEVPDGGEAPGEDAPEQSGEPEGEPEEESQEESEVGGTINVLVPTGGRVTVNPYRLPVATPWGATNEQVVHEPQALVNLSEVPVQVDAWAIGAFDGPGTAVFVPAPPAAGEVDKEIFMYAEFQPFPGQWTGGYGNFDNQLLITGWGESKADMLTLAPGGEGYFRLSGAMTDSPAEMWEEEDAVDVTFVFSFFPLEMPVQADSFPEETFFGEDAPAETVIPTDMGADYGW